MNKNIKIISGKIDDSNLPHLKGTLDGDIIELRVAD